MTASRLAFLLGMLTSLLVLNACADGTPLLTPAEAAQRVAEGKAVLVDVREPAEWADTGVAAPALLLPLSDLTGERRQWKPFLEKLGDKELILYCRSGNRSGRAAKLLAEEGHRTANAGSFRAWQAAGLPTRTLPPPAAK